MPEIDVLYFIEHTARELDTACAVKHLLQRDYGLDCQVASITDGLTQRTSAWEPRVITLPFCVQISDLGLDKIISRWPQARYINLAFEQVLGKTQKDFKAPKDAFTRQYVLHHAWGDFYAEYLQAYGVAPELTVVNGNPSLALYCPPYRAYYEQDREQFAARYGLDPHKRWVFIPENYGWAFFRDHMLRDRIRRGFNAEDAYRYRDFARDSLRDSARWWREAGEQGQVEVIVRPRPAIPQESFAQAVRDLAGEIPAGLHIIKDGTVREWILASDIVLSSYSTTLLEAAIAQKPVYMMTPHPIPDFLYNEWYDLTTQLSTQQAFLDAIYAEPVGRNWEALEGWVRTLMMSRGDAIANLASLLDGVSRGRQAPPPPLEIAERLRRPNYDRIKRRLRRFGWNLMQDTAAALGFKTDRDWTAHEQDSLPASEVDRRVARWAEILKP